jgi:hypothetical protein
MTELKCDEYMNKVEEIKDMSEDPETTLSSLQTLINELSVLDSQIDNDLSTIDIPTTMTHLNKLIIVQIERSRKATLQNSLQKLIECRNSNIDTVVLNGTYENALAYQSETKNIDNFVENTVIPSCDCMKIRMEIVKRISKGK